MNHRWFSDFEKGDRVLLLGEGNFSFSVALCKHNLDIDVTATCYGNDFISSQAKDNAAWLQDHGVKILLGVDATKMLEHPELKAAAMEKRLFHKIIFNFPHVGGKMRLDLNRKLLKDFFVSCNDIVYDKDNSRILVTLCNGQGGTELDIPRRQYADTWKIAEMAALGNCQLIDMQMFPYEIFDDYEVTGYRGLDKSFHMENAITHILRVAPPFDVSDFVPHKLVTKDELIETTKHSKILVWLDFCKPIKLQNEPTFDFDITFAIFKDFDEIDFFVLLQNKLGSIVRNVIFLGFYEFPQVMKITRSYRITYGSNEQPLYRARVLQIHTNYLADLLEKELGVIVTR